MAAAVKGADVESFLVFQFLSELSTLLIQSITITYSSHSLAASSRLAASL